MAQPDGKPQWQEVSCRSHRPVAEPGDIFLGYTQLAGRYIGDAAAGARAVLASGVLAEPAIGHAPCPNAARACFSSPLQPVLARRGRKARHRSRFRTSAAHDAQSHAATNQNQAPGPVTMGSKPWTDPLRLRLQQYRAFLATCWRYVGEEKTLFVAFVLLSILGALTEAVGIGLFVPLLDTVSNRPNFGNIPLLSRMSEAFGQIPPDIRLK